MNSEEYQKMYDLEDKYWWFVGRRKLLSSVFELYILDKRDLLFDLGCGTGLNLMSFANSCRAVGADRSFTALGYCRQRNVQTVFQCEAESIPLKSNSVDVVTALDVLEHLKEDEEALKEIHRALKPGGLLIATVPAYGFLWSEHDEALHHYRRYTALEMRMKLSASGFELERTTYYITFLFAPILLFRLWQNLFDVSHHPSVSYIMPPRWINDFFIWLLDVEAQIMKFINLPFGISIICIARKALDTSGCVDRSQVEG